MAHFTSDLFQFLRDLAENNDRDWFKANKGRYDEHVLSPCLGFIEAIAAPLASISPAFLAIPKAQGGSMFRIYRDTRFSKDKTPYKTHVGLQFRHRDASRDVHAPGFYLHLEPSKSAIGVGMWHPDSQALGRIRERVVADPDGWRTVREGLMAAELEFMGESLKRPPRGYSADHEHVEDLKRKDWAVHRPVPEDAVLSDAAVDAVTAQFTKASPLVRYLCETQGLAY